MPLADYPVGEQPKMPEGPKPVAMPIYPAQEKPIMRRFDLPDIDQQAPWLFPRLQKTFHWLPPNSIRGWLTQMVWSNDYKLLFLPNAIGCAQLWRAFSAEPVPVVFEKFIFIRDPKSKEQQREALQFYDEFKDWAQLNQTETLILGEFNDIPMDFLKEHFDRVLERTLHFVKVPPKQPL